MAGKANKEKKKKSGWQTVLSFVFDLTYLGLLIWFFASVPNQRFFWNTIAGCCSKTVVAVAQQMHWKIPEQALPETKKNAPGSQSDSAELHAGKVALAEAQPHPVPPSAAELKTEMPGDCFPPEATAEEQDAPAIAKLFCEPPPLPRLRKHRIGHGKPLQFAKKQVKGVPLYQVTMDLNDPETFLVIRLPKKSAEANNSSFTAGHDAFSTFVKQYPSAVQVNGTFFSKDQQERVMGNMVSEGKILKYSRWESYGTTLALREGDYPEMVTARAEGKPDWDKHWFSLTCGPRLLKQGQEWINPELEGFQDPHVLGCGPRSAIGFPRSRDKLFLVTFLRGLSLKEEAKLMKALGCYEAMNLDGGASKALSHDNDVVVNPGRGLTNVLVLYDSRHKAPPDVIADWERFQESPQAESVCRIESSRSSAIKLSEAESE